MYVLSSPRLAHILLIRIVAVVLAVMLTSTRLPAAGQRKERPVANSTLHRTIYRTAKVDGLSIFYREAGPKDAPVLLLLHGFPTSSRMFRNLIPALADRYHIIAPDYPGFGYR